MAAATYPATLEYRVFERRHPSYDAKRWKICRALYAGGRELLGDAEVMKEIFPKHAAELDEVYRERKERAYFLPYPGEIIDAIVASLAATPVTMSAEPELPPLEETFYSEFAENVAKEGGQRQTLNQLLRDQILVALQCRTAWTLVDLPPSGAAPAEGAEVPEASGPEYTNLAEQIQAGLLRAYACPIAPENVCDWEEDDSGELEWVLIRAQEQKRSGLTESRENITERWTYYDRSTWARYTITYKADSPPSSGAEVKLENQGTHSFEGRVPVLRLKLPPGLAAMQKIESIAIAHFNKRNALTWAELKSLFPVPVAYLGTGDPMNPVTENENRATQPHAVGYMRVLAEKDRLEYFGPDSAPFEFAGQDLNNLRDEMHRVLHHMALAVDNSGAALGRSADSKAIDQAVAAVVLGALGGYVREHGLEIYRMVALGRGDEEKTWTAHGMDDFDDTTTAALLEQALNLEAVQIPSSTFQVEYRFGIAKRLLGAKTPRETLQAVRDELNKNMSPEMYDVEAQAKKAELDTQKRQNENAPDDPEAAAHERQIELEKTKAKAKGPAKKAK